MCCIADSLSLTWAINMVSILVLCRGPSVGFAVIHYHNKEIILSIIVEEGSRINS